MENIELALDVSDAAGLGEQATIAVTVHLPAPEALGSPSIVCVAKPGGGFSREYFTAPLPGASQSQAQWHAEHGWIFVSVDHLGVGSSSAHHDPHRLGYSVVTAAGCQAEQMVLDRLRSGTLHPSFPPVGNPVVLGLGQSMGGSVTVAQQGRYHCYDGIGVLGYSVIHTRIQSAPGMAPLVRPWHLRDTLSGEPPVVLNTAQVEVAQRRSPPDLATANDWVFYHDDVDPDTVRQGPWTSATYPLGVVTSCITPGTVAPEAAAVDVPVLLAMGERDVVADPKGEPRAYLSAASVDLFVCPRMGHMHNFASTRELFWDRIRTWGSWVAAARR